MMGNSQYCSGLVNRVTQGDCDGAISDVNELTRYPRPAMISKTPSVFGMRSHLITSRPNGESQRPQNTEAMMIPCSCKRTHR